ncbi:helix-turn-helix domain-containing protein [Lysobacter enzymogenes]|uniref:helix-turn-helix domain-containing protein n=1 Tax=Lysobacter enzymogenes TaxID=69 RepID=UPI00384FC5E1
MHGPTVPDIDAVAMPESPPAQTRTGCADATSPQLIALTGRGQVVLDSAELRRLRQSRLLSQQDLAEDCWRRNIRVSVATIKRAESGRAVRFRIAHELARCFGVPVMALVRAAPAA